MKTAFTLLFLFITFFIIAQSQNDKEIDSLTERLQKIKGLEAEQNDIETTHEKIEVLCRLSKAYDGIDSTKTFDYGLQALHLSENLNYTQGMAHANFMLGRALMYYDYKKAFAYLKEGEKLIAKLIKEEPSEKIKRIWASGVYNLGITHGYLGEHGKEIAYTEKVMPIVKSLGDSIFLANIYSNLGVKHLNLAEYENAYDNLQQSIAIYQALGSPREKTFALIQLASAYEELDSLEQMKSSLDEAALNLDKYPNLFDEFHFLIQRSQYHLKNKAFDSALFNLQKARTLLGTDTESIQYGMIEQRIAKVYEAKNEFSKARQHMSAYIENSQLRKNHVSIFQGYYKRAQYFAALNDHKNAYEDLTKAFTIYDSIEIKELKTRLDELKIKYESVEREKALLALQNAKNEAGLALEKQRSRTYLYAVIIGSLAFLIFAGYIFYRNKLRKARRKERIREAEVQLLKQEQQNKIFSAMIEGQEKERKRLAIDLHDGLGGRLSGISLNLSKLDKDEPKQYPKKQLQKVIKDLNDSLQELRSIARNLMPETLVKFGLQAALKDYCSSMTGGNTKVTLQYYGSEKDIEPNQQVTMYRVIQELINNAIKHANASEVLVQYIREGTTVNITVEDNGVGFAKEIVEKKNTGMGLTNLRTRVAYLKGELDVQSQANEGTTVNVHINIDAA